MIEPAKKTSLKVVHFTGFPCDHILTRKNLFSLKGIMFSLQGPCFHNTGVSLHAPDSTLYKIAVYEFLFFKKHVETIKKYVQAITLISLFF